jgi:hypothetical protein
MAAAPLLVAAGLGGLEDGEQLGDLELDLAMARASAPGYGHALCATGCGSNFSDSSTASNRSPAAGQALRPSPPFPARRDRRR